MIILGSAWNSWHDGRMQVGLLARDGLGYANTTLRGSAVIDAVKALPEDLLIYSNYPQILYLIAGHPATMTPIIYGTVTTEVQEDYVTDLEIMRAEDIAAGRVFLIYFYELDYANDPYYLQLTEDLFPLGEYPFAFVFGSGH
jgi:hypothetical protein